MIERHESITAPVSDARFCFGIIPSVVHPSLLMDAPEKPAAPSISTHRELVTALIDAHCCERLANAVADRVWTDSIPCAEALRKQCEYHSKSAVEHQGAAVAIEVVLWRLTGAA